MSQESSKNSFDERLTDVTDLGPFAMSSMRSLTVALLAEGARLSRVPGAKLKGSLRASQISSAWSRLRHGPDFI
jgi:hypothetical protein